MISNEKNVKRFTFFANQKRDKCDVYVSVGGDRVNCGPLRVMQSIQNFPKLPETSGNFRKMENETT